MSMAPGSAIRLVLVIAEPDRNTQQPIRKPINRIGVVGLR